MAQAGDALMQGGDSPRAIDGVNRLDRVKGYELDHGFRAVAMNVCHRLREQGIAQA